MLALMTVIIVVRLTEHNPKGSQSLPKEAAFEGNPLATHAHRCQKEFRNHEPTNTGVG